jgi:hypothetical protein
VPHVQQDVSSVPRQRLVLGLTKDDLNEPMNVTT